MGKYKAADLAQWAKEAFNWDLTPELVRIPVEDAINNQNGWISLEVQRPLDEGRAVGIADHYMPAVADGVEAVWCPEGKTVVDGQHRLYGAHLAGAPFVWGLLFRVATKEQAHVLFCLKNGDAVRLARAIDILKKRGLAGEPTASAIETVLNEYECFIDVAHSRKQGGIYASVVLQTIYNVDNGDLLARTLDVITESWGHGTKALLAEVIEGVALFLSHYEAELSAGQIRELKTALTRVGIERILAAVNVSSRDQRSVKRSVHVEYELLTTFNKKRTSRRLTERTSRQLAQLPSVSHLQRTTTRVPAVAE